MSTTPTTTTPLVTIATDTNTTIDSVLNFWFKELTMKQHFMKDEVVDNAIRTRYEYLIKEVKDGKHDTLSTTPLGNLTLIIILDQFSRNMYRNSPESFAQDEQALKLSKLGVKRGDLEQLPTAYKSFLCMPYMHSESLQDQNDSIPLFEGISEYNKEFAIKHQVIIEKYGRFPHRNMILNRISTPEEIEFLTQENSSF